MTAWRAAVERGAGDVVSNAYPLTFETSASPPVLVIIEEGDDDGGPPGWVPPVVVAGGAVVIGVLGWRLAGSVRRNRRSLTS